MRTLPLVPVFRERLAALQAEQKENRRLCGRCYNPDYIGYVFVDEMGNRIKPNYLSNAFGKLLANNGLRVIRFHDLRQLRQHDAGQRRCDEADSGMARTQRLFNDGQYLRTLGLQLQAVLGRGDADWPGIEGC